MVPQAFDMEAGGAGRPPTLAEERVMTYLCLIHGAHGLIFYSYFDLLQDKKAGFESRWKDMLVVGREVKRLEPALLSSCDPQPVAVHAPEGIHHCQRADDDCLKHHVDYVITSGAVREWGGLQNLLCDFNVAEVGCAGGRAGVRVHDQAQLIGAWGQRSRDLQVMFPAHDLAGLPQPGGIRVADQWRLQSGNALTAAVAQHQLEPPISARLGIGLPV
jgi:hypothetical protein